MDNLKDYREKELSFYIIANILIFLIVHKFINIDTSDLSNTEGVISQIVVSTVLSFIAYSFILVVECLFTSEFKAKLLYLFGFLSEPGNTIFTKIKTKNNDKRFSCHAIEEKYPELYANFPTEKKAKQCYENEKWFAIYNQYRDVGVIHYSNRDSLLCRDIYISTVVFISLYAIVSIIKLVCFNWKYLLFIISLAIITNIGANCKAVRFAYNVIAYDVSNISNKNK